MPDNNRTLDLNYTGNPWDRQPGETNRQYKRFLTFLELGRFRTIPILQDTLKKLGEDLRLTSLNQLSKYGRWQDRASHWDTEQDKGDYDRMMQERREVIQEHKDVAKRLIAKALEALDYLAVDQMTPQDVVRYLKLATDLGRAIYGDPSQIIAVTGPGGGPIQTEELTKLSDAERRARLVEISAELARRAGIEDTEDD